MKYEMKLDNEPFNSIKDKTKRIELRLNDEKRRLLKVNDLIEFTNRDTKEKILVKIINLYYYDTFEELYKHFDKVLMGYKEEDVANPKDMEKYYSKDKQKKYGVIAIEVEICYN